MGIKLVIFKKRDTTPEQIADLKAWVQKQKIEDQLQAIKKDLAHETTTSKDSKERKTYEEKKLRDDKARLLENIERVERFLKIITLISGAVLSKTKVLSNYNNLLLQLDGLNKEIATYNNNPFRSAQSEITKKKTSSTVKQPKLIKELSTPKVTKASAAHIVHAEIKDASELEAFEIAPPISFAPKVAKKQASAATKTATKSTTNVNQPIAKGEAELGLYEILEKTKFDKFLKDAENIYGEDSLRDIKTDMSFIKSTFEYIKSHQDRLTTDEQMILALAAIDAIKSIYQDLSDRTKVQDVNIFGIVREHGLTDSFSKRLQELKQLLKKNWPDTYENMTEPELLQSAREMLYDHLGGDHISKQAPTQSTLYESIVHSGIDQIIQEYRRTLKDQKYFQADIESVEKRLNEIIVRNLRKSLNIIVVEPEQSPSPSPSPRRPGRHTGDHR